MVKNSSSPRKRTTKAVSPTLSTTSSTTESVPPPVPVKPKILSKARQQEILDLIAKGASPAGACLRVGVSVTKFYQVLQKSPTLQAQLEEVYRIMNQNVESALYQTAMKGNVTAQTLWLKNRPPPGWATRNEAMHTDHWDRFTDEELGELARAEGLSLPPELAAGTTPPCDAAEPGSVSP